MSVTRLPDEDSNSSEGIPNSIGPYTLERIVGRGGMGEVYAAYDQRLERRVAVKHLRADKPLSPKAQERFRREAKAAAALSHPSIVQVFDIIEDEADGEWIVMEFVEGESLAQRLLSGPISPVDAIPMGLQVLDGLSYAHQQGFLHRDLKTENVMLGLDGRVKILDLGLAKRLMASESSLTADGVVVGTFRAMSPEQARGYELDLRSDLFSFGVLLYEMLTGTSPFRADSSAETLVRICTFQPEELHQLDASIPVELSRLVDQLLAKSPHERPSSELARSTLDTCRQRLENPAQPPEVDTWNSIAALDTLEGSLDSPPLPSQPTRRNPTIFKAGIGFLGLALVTGGWLAMKTSTSSHQPGASVSSISDHETNRKYRQGMELLSRADIDGNVDEAVVLFEKLVEQRPDLATGHAGLAHALWYRARNARDEATNQAALQSALRAVELDPFFAPGHVSLGLARIAVEPEQALEAFETALRLDPSAADAHMGMGRLYDEVLDNNEAALASYRRSVEVRPDNHELRNIFGAFLWRIGKMEEAAEQFSKSIELVPDSVFAYSNLAGVHFMQGDFDSAASLLQRALQVRPEASIYTNLGTIYFYQGRYAESIQPFLKATETKEGATDPLTWSNLGDAYRWAEGYEEETRQAYGTSVELLRKQVGDGLRPDLEKETQLALILARRGDWAEALQRANKLEKRPRIGPMIEFDLVMIYEQCGERRQALSLLERALESGLPLEVVLREQELDRLRNDPDFDALISKHRKAKGV